MKTLTFVFAWFFGSSEPSYFTVDTADTEDTAEPLDDTADETTEETGDTEDSGDTADTAGDSAEEDTALKSAMELAGENGGFGCATVEPGAAISIFVGMMALGLRRRD